MDEIFSSLSTYGYVILFLYTLGGGMVAIIAAGVLSFVGEMNLALCIFIATISNFSGDTLLFYIGRYAKAEFVMYLKKQRRNLALAQILFKKHGGKIILFKKYIYGLKTLVPVAIALTKYSFIKFSVINIISSAIWALSLGLVSFYAGDFILKIVDFIKQYPFLMPIFIFLILGAIFMYFTKTTKKKAKFRRKL